MPQPDCRVGAESDPSGPVGCRSVDTVLDHGVSAYRDLVARDPVEIARFLDAFASMIDSQAPTLASLAESETSLPADTRFVDVEIPRTVDQLRQAANAAVSRSWREPTVNATQNVARLRQPIPGPVVVMGPNNFPFAFNAVCGGDFAAAIASCHPVIARANPGHLRTTRRLAELCSEALHRTGLPTSTMQPIFELDPADGLKLVADSRIAATAFTGSKRSGMALKAAADAAGRPIYLEMSSMNPIVVLPEALIAAASEIAAQIVTSITTGSGQFCTKPGLVFVPSSGATNLKIAITAAVKASPGPFPLLGADTYDMLKGAVDLLRSRGARTVFVGPEPDTVLTYPTTILEIDADDFLANPSAFQEEAFGNVTTLVIWDSLGILEQCVEGLEGSLAASVYFADRDEPSLEPVLGLLRERVGRLVANRPPTGVQVVAAMNHGGPFPVSGHPGFTSVGIPESLKRFTMLQTFDGFPSHLLPPELAPDNPLDLMRVELP